MTSANCKAPPPFIFHSTQPQQVVIIFLLCIALLTSFFITVFGTGDNSSRRGCIKAERDALLAFKAGTIYDKAHPISTWGDQTDDCCQWAGVRCDNNSGHVIRLNPHLRRRPPYNYYHLYYYDEEPGLSGNMSESLIGLRHLTYLNLRGNCFLDSSIPKWVGSLESLVHLDLSFNCFTAVIPHELGNLTKLRYLNLAENIRPKVVDDAEWLSGLSSLRYLSMDRADFSGVDNVMQSLNKLHHLKYISLFDCSMSGIPESLPHLNFSSLTSMNISRNMFYNMSIPEWLFRIPNLHDLSVSDCGWTGTIPSSVGNATSLQSLDLSWNEGISGDIPRGLIGDLCNLQQLYLDGTFVGKSLEEDFRDAFSGWIRRNLNVLSFVYSSLKGPLPDWLGEFRNLTMLSLAYNALNGPIPESLFKLSNLVFLDLSGNNFNYSYVITEAHLANLTSLEYLSLDQLVLNISIDWIPRFQALQINLSYCDIGPKFPVWLANQVNLDRLDISNTGIKDSMPDWFWNITYTMDYLDLSNNEINGRLPQRLKFQAEEEISVGIFLSSNHFEGSVPYFPPNVLALDLSNNSLSGTIPSDLGNFGGRTPQLWSLSLSSNNLTGSIPNSLCNLVGLASLELSNNHLEGAIPNCWNNLTQLRYLILANNLLEGEAPDTLVNSSPSLRVLHLSNNQLHGGFPSFLKKCTSMTTLALDHNNLSGHIPSWVGETMTSLMILTLKQNNFSGNLPLLSNLTSLHFLDLSHNSFIGSIPQSYGSLMGMINVSMNGGARFTTLTREGLVIKIIVSAKGIELQYGVSLSSFKFIDLSANNLSGQIPKEIVNLAGLQNLDLSYNNLSGEIPSDIGLMQSLESLDLSRNELTGSIPPALCMLHFLESFNLSHNNLFGKIPYASQLTTFNDPSVYAGNLNLCGAPLDKNCTSDEPSSNSHDQEVDGDDNDSRTIWFCIGLMSGSVVGFWIVWGVLLFKKEWRYAYFKFLDHIYDMMYVKIFITIPKIKRALVVMNLK